MIPEAKIRALRDRLEADGSVTFANGTVVRRETKVELVIEGQYGGVTRLGEDELRLAYDLALNGSQRKRQPSGDPEKFGDEAPWTDEDLNLPTGVRS